MSRRRITPLLVPAILAALTMSACHRENPQSRALAGLWESTYRGRGGEANSLVMSGDSLIQRVYLKAFDFRYSAWGDSLRLELLIPDSLWPPGATAAPSLVLQYTIRGDTLVRNEPHRTEWLVRRGDEAGDPHSLVGTWKVVRSTDAVLVPSLQRFRPDSMLQVRMPVSTMSGVYRAQPDSIVFLLETDTSRCALSLRGDTLDVTRTFTNGTFTFTYLRASPELWY